jgi:hypothetical protein
MGRPLNYSKAKIAHWLKWETGDIGRNEQAKKVSKHLPLRATFVDDDDGRYASVGGIIYPVLLATCRGGLRYSEDVSDSVDYPSVWCRRFRQDLECRAAAILISDADDHSWKFLGLFQVHNVQLSNFLTCRIGAKLANTQLLPG